MIALLLLLQTDPFAETEARLREAYDADDAAAARALFSEGMAHALSEEALAGTFAGLHQAYGDWTSSGPMSVAGRTATFPAVFERGTLSCELTLDAAGRVEGWWLRPPRAEVPVPERNSVALSLPFRGTWRIVWGGDTREENYHHDVPNQRFAFDIVEVGEGESSHRGDGRANEDYYAFGREILAAADGVVEEAADGVRDNVPGSMNPYSAVGNFVVIRHAEREFALYAHLQRGSVRVRAGQEVRRGDVLGLCGNSGNSSEPHLHFHLMNVPTIQDATGIKVYFDRVAVTRDAAQETREDYSPVRGDVVAP